MPFSSTFQIGGFAIVSAFVAFAGAGVGDLVLPEAQRDPLKPVGIEVNEIAIHTDGSVIYDRTVLVDGAWYTWSGIAFDPTGKEICKGSNSWKYPASTNRRQEVDVPWIFDNDTCGVLPAGTLYVFSYTSVDGTLRDARYPKTGYAVVKEPNL